MMARPYPLVTAWLTERGDPLLLRGVDILGEPIRSLISQGHHGIDVGRPSCRDGNAIHSQNRGVFTVLSSLSL